MQVLEEINRQIERYLVVQVFTSVVVGIATWLVLLALGISQPGIWGLLAGLLNTIPYFGPVIVAMALGVVGFIQFGTVGMAAAVAGASLLITTLEGFVLTPLLVGRAARMNQVAVFVGLIFWSWIWGIPGMLLAIPMMTTLKAICDRVEDLQSVGEILGD